MLKKDLSELSIRGPAEDSQVDIWARLIAHNSPFLARALVKGGTLILAMDIETGEDGEQTFGIRFEPLQATIHSN